MVDLKQLQAEVEALKQLKRSKPKKETPRRSPEKLPEPVYDKWAFLKDYPGQSLSDREFTARLDAYRDMKRQERNKRYYEQGGLEKDVIYGPKKSDFRRKFRRK
jgi:hypothetical protein